MLIRLESRAVFSVIFNGWHLQQQSRTSTRFLKRLDYQPPPPSTTVGFYIPHPERLQVMVMDVSDEEEAGCSDEFYLMAHEEAPTVGDADGPYITVTSPTEGDSAEVGEEYTVEVRKKGLVSVGRERGRLCCSCLR